MGFEWTELMYLQIIAGSTTGFVFGGAVVLVFLVLAGQYESWSLPLAVILVVPMCILCSVVGVAHRADGHQHLHPDRLRRAGRPGQQERHSDRRVRQVETRSRPAAARGHAGRLPAAAAADHHDLASPSSWAWCRWWSPPGPAPKCGGRSASAVFSGMLGVTLFGIFLTPVFYYVIQWFSDRRLAKRG